MLDGDPIALPGRTVDRTTLRRIAAVLIAIAILAPVPAAQAAVRDPSPLPGPSVTAAGVSAPMSREEAASRSDRAHDLRGPLPSLYRGVYFRAEQETFRLCVGAREGSHTYQVRGGGGGNYFGTYQMSAALARGVTWMMAAESRRTHDGLRADARALHDVPANHWSRYWQDRAFFTILNYRGLWSGKHHWAGGRWRC